MFGELLNETYVLPITFTIECILVINTLKHGPISFKDVSFKFFSLILIKPHTNHFQGFD